MHLSADAFDITQRIRSDTQAVWRGRVANACLICARLSERGVRMTQIIMAMASPWMITRHQ